MRIMKWMRVLEISDSGPKHRRICYAYKIADDVNNVGHSRYMLFDEVYSHHASQAYEHK